MPRNANRSIKLGDILIEVARSADFAVAFASEIGREKGEKNVTRSPRVLIRAATCVFFFFFFRLLR